MFTITKGIWIGAAILVLAIGAWLFRDSQIVDTRADRARAQLEMITSALHDYASRHGRFPSADEGLGALVADSQFKASALIDPWGRPITYKCVSTQCASVVLTVTDMTPQTAGGEKVISHLVERK